MKGNDLTDYKSYSGHLSTKLVEEGNKNESPDIKDESLWLILRNYDY